MSANATNVTFINSTNIYIDNLQAGGLFFENSSDITLAHISLDQAYNAIEDLDFVYFGFSFINSQDITVTHATTTGNLTFELVANASVSLSTIDNKYSVYSLTFNRTNSTTITSNSIICNGESDCEKSLLFDNQSYGNKIYNNYFRGNDRDHVGFVFEGGTSSNNVFNTTKGYGARRYSDGNKIGGNYYDSDSGDPYFGYSGSCADANTDGFCDAPFVLFDTGSVCSGTATCSQLLNESDCTDNGNYINNPLCIWTGSVCEVSQTCGGGSDPCLCSDITGEGQTVCEQQTYCSWSSSGIIDYLPYSDEFIDGARLNVITYDTDTLARIYFGISITNGTQTNASAYNYEFDNYTADLPLGQVNMTFTNSSYYPTDYSTYLTNTTSIDLTVYMANISNSNYNIINFIVLNTNGQLLPGALVQIYQIWNNTNVMVGSKYTDSSGTAGFWLDRSVSYTILVTKAGYQSQTNTIIPTNSPYYITLATSYVPAVGFPNQVEGTEWAIGPRGCWIENETINFQASITNVNCSLEWWSATLRNGTTVLHTENNSINTCGGVVSHTFVPGPNANVSISIDWKVLNRTAFHQGLTWRTCQGILPGVGPQGAKNSLLGGALNPFTVTLIFLLIAVMVAGWVGQFSPTFGVLAFLIVIAFGSWFSFGLLGVGAVMLLLIMVVFAYYGIRGGF
jgi:hypothetical protein